MRFLKSTVGGSSYALPAVIGAVVLFVLNVIVQPSIVDHGNWAPTVAVASAFVLVAIAQTPALLVGGGGLDLSVGPLAGLVAVIVAKSSATGLIPSLALILGLGIASGLIIGALVAFLRVPPIIATLGAYLFYSGLAVKLLPAPGGHAPPWIADLAGDIGPIPGMWLPLAAIAIFWIALTRTAFRRNLFAVGGDARAAYTAGINVSLVRVAAYTLSGLFAAVAGIAFLAVLGSADANAAPPYTLISMAGAALGGVSLGGGRGGLLGAAAGGAILFLIQNLLGLAGVSVFDLQIAFGAILILALALNSYSERRRKRGNGGRRAGRGSMLAPPSAPVAEA